MKEQKEIVLEKFKSMSGTRLGDWIRYGQALQVKFKPLKKRRK